MSVAETSRLAFEKVKVTKKEGEVFEAFKQLGVATNDDIAELLGWPINCVTGRTNGLVKKNYLALADTNGKTRMGNRAKRWSVVERNDEHLIRLVRREHEDEDLFRNERPMMAVSWLNDKEDCAA